MKAAKCVAVIPARGGSKGLPRKNVLPLGGRPLIAHTITELLAAESVSSVWVSTDDAEIAEAARRYGAGVIDRPEELANDTATSESALLHALSALPPEVDDEFVMMVQCTSPLTRAEDFTGLCRTLIEQNADSAFTASPFHHFVWEQAANGSAAPVGHAGKKRMRRQDMNPHYLENGAAYLMNRALFAETGERFCGRVVLHPMDEARTLEIDTLSDFQRAEAVLAATARERTGARIPSPLGALVMDFDGVFTDNRVLVTDDGHEAVMCDRGDGMGLGLVAAQGIPLLILSKEKNPVVMRRAEKLRIECVHGVDDKPTLLKRWLSDRRIDPDSTIYIGNDVNDLGCMQLAGCAVAPRDAHASAIAAADIVLERDGGRGALRELCDLILENRGDARE